MSNPTTENLLGKCKEPGCDYVIFATREDVQDAENFREVTAGTGVYKVGNNGFFARCTNRHKFFAVKRVKGTYSETHQCDSRCLNAKGWECTCSCGGANHGRGHVATVVQASAIASPSTDQFYNEMREARVEASNPAARKHLGEVGKYIRGEVIVTQIAVHTPSGEPGNRPYEFLTEGGDKIVWWVPEYADPQWELRSTHTIRAKVKAHDEFRGEPKTIVIYVEEVQ